LEHNTLSLFVCLGEDTRFEITTSSPKITKINPEEKKKTQEIAPRTSEIQLATLEKMSSLPNAVVDRRKPKKVVTLESIPLLSRQSADTTKNGSTPSQLATKRAKRPANRDRTLVPEGWKGRIAVFCNAEAYKQSLIEFLSSKREVFSNKNSKQKVVIKNSNIFLSSLPFFFFLSQLQPIQYDDVIHIQKEEEKNIFLFPYGVTIFWGYTIREETDFLALVCSSN
jgi:uncharacterized Rmd1/YagE family protein